MKLIKDFIPHKDQEKDNNTKNDLLKPGNLLHDLPLLSDVGHADSDKSKRKYLFLSFIYSSNV